MTAYTNPSRTEPVYTPPGNRLHSSPNLIPVGEPIPCPPRSGKAVLVDKLGHVRVPSPPSIPRLPAQGGGMRVGRYQGAAPVDIPCRISNVNNLRPGCLTNVSIPHPRPKLQFFYLRVRSQIVALYGRRRPRDRSSRSVFTIQNVLRVIRCRESSEIPPALCPVPVQDVNHPVRAEPECP